MRGNVKLRIRALSREKRLKCDLPATPWTKAWIAWLRGEPSWSGDDRWILDQQFERLAQLSTQITETEKRLKSRVDDDPLVKKLLSLDGVGLITAVTIRTEIGRFDRFQNGKQLARFCGLSPRNVSSGQRQADAGLIRAAIRSCAGVDRVGAATDVDRRQRRAVALASARPSIAESRQAAQRGRRRGGEPLDSLAVLTKQQWPLAPAEAQAATETNAVAAPKRRPTTSAPARQKGGRPFRLHLRLGPRRREG